MFKDLKKKRNQLSKLNEGGLTVSQVEQGRKLIREIEGMVHMEEILWRQRHRAIWLREGYRNIWNFFTNVRRVENGRILLCA